SRSKPTGQRSSSDAGTCRSCAGRALRPPRARPPRVSSLPRDRAGPDAGAPAPRTRCIHSNLDPMSTISLPAASTPPASARDLRDARNDRWFRWMLTGTVAFVLVALAGAALSMLWGGRDALATQGWSFFFSAEWNPVENRYGALVPIYGTLVTAVIAMV